MLNIPLNNGLTLNIPNGWNEVTVETYCKAVNKKGNELAAAILGITEEILLSLPEWFLADLWQHLSFTLIDVSYEPETLSNPPQIALEPIAKLERVKMFLTTYEIWEAAANIYAVYYYPQSGRYFNETEADNYAVNIVDKMLITDIYTQFVYIVEEVNKFATRYKAIFEQEEQGENELAAGVQRFEKYGFFATLYKMCNGNPTKYRKMLQTPADVFYMTLAFEKELTDYRKELNKLNKISDNLGQ